MIPGTGSGALDAVLQVGIVAALFMGWFGPRGLKVYREIRVGKSIIGKNRCIDVFCDESGWIPERTERVAGCLQYREYDVFTRLLMRVIAHRHGGSTDTSHDHDLTDYEQVDREIIRTLSPSAVTVVPAPSSARFCMSAMFSAIAMPTAVSSCPFAAEPSAIAEASMLFSAFRLRAPTPSPSPATIATSPLTEASATLEATFSASAAPTPTDPPLPSPSSVEALFLSAFFVSPDCLLARPAALLL